MNKKYFILIMLILFCFKNLQGIEFNYEIKGLDVYKNDIKYFGLKDSIDDVLKNKMNEKEFIPENIIYYLLDDLVSIGINNQNNKISSIRFSFRPEFFPRISNNLNNKIMQININGFKLNRNYSFNDIIQYLKQNKYNFKIDDKMKNITVELKFGKFWIRYDKEDLNKLLDIEFYSF